jgi:hypothetical protein
VRAFRHASIRPELLTDLDGLGYIGAQVPAEHVSVYLDLLRGRVGDARFGELVAGKARRDGPEIYHLTMVTPPELSLSSAEHAPPEGPIDVVLGGLGRVTDGVAEAFFIVVESPGVVAMRSRLELGPKALHVTLGFSPTDIYGMDKGPQTVVAHPDEL